MIRICTRNIQSLALQRNVSAATSVTRGFCEKSEKDQLENSEITGDKKLSGFAKAFEKHATPVQEVKNENKLPDLPFATLLRNSKLVNVSN